MDISRNYHWPKDDHYFGMGVSELVSELNKKISMSGKTSKHQLKRLVIMEQDFAFINLNGYSLVGFLNEVKQCVLSKKKIIIIATEMLMPLACFCLTADIRVFAVFDCRCKVSEIVNELFSKLLKTQKNNDVKVNEPFYSFYYKKERTLQQSPLTHKDVLMLRIFFTEENSSFNNILGFSSSSVYRWKVLLAGKFGVRKLELLSR